VNNKDSIRIKDFFLFLTISVVDQGRGVLQVLEPFLFPDKLKKNEKIILKNYLEKPF
jgi:hypothetical protein